MALTFEHRPHPQPRSPEQIAELLVNPGFGQVFSDHMAVATWTKGEGWHDAAIKPYGPIQLDPSAAVLHYAQEIFEGMKAYRHADGSVWLFRPEQNGQRFNRSAKRMMLPELPVEDFVNSVVELVRTDVAYVPDGDQEKSLYLRPFMIATEPFLGVRASHEVLYSVIASPVGAYFPEGVKPIDIWVTDEYSRAGVGGTGAAKCGGNYASSLIAQYEGYEQGCSQVLFIEAATKDRLEELGGMNLFVITADGQLLTPELTGTILEGVTRDSILKTADMLGLRPQEVRLGPDELRHGVESGDIVEAFCCGTAAVISPIAAFKSKKGEYRLADTAHEKTLALRNAITDIQFGRAEDPFGWMQRVV